MDDKAFEDNKDYLIVLSLDFSSYEMSWEQFEIVLLKTKYQI